MEIDKFVKDVLVKNRILFLVSSVVLLAAVYLMFVFPPSLILDLFWNKVDAEEIEERNYYYRLIVGLPAGDGIQVLEDKEQFDTVHYGEHYEFYTFETDSIIPLSAYQLKSTADVTNTYRVRNATRTGSPRPLYRDDSSPIIWDRIKYNRYYLVALPDGNYVISYLDDAYYVKYLLTHKVQLPVGCVKTIDSTSEKDLLQPIMERYGIEGDRILLMFSQERYENYKTLCELIPAMLFIIVLASYVGAVYLISENIKKRKKAAPDEQ